MDCVPYLHLLHGSWLRVFPGRRVLDEQWIEPTEQQVRQLAEDKEKIKKIRKRRVAMRPDAGIAGR